MSTTTKDDIVFVETRKENFYCSICNYPFLSNKDFSASDQYCTCHDCFLTFIENRKEEWKKGWRPKQNVIDTYKENKKQLYSNIGVKSEL